MAKARTLRDATKDPIVKKETHMITTEKEPSGKKDKDFLKIVGGLLIGAAIGTITVWFIRK